MIKEAYISFEVAKLLKEKGFDIPIDSKNWLCCMYDKNENVHWGIYDKNWYLRITHQTAMKWLREIYHIEINITFGFPFINGKQQYKYFWSVVRVCDNHLEYPMNDPNSAFYNEEIADSYEEAVEAAIKYCLEKIIK